MELTHFNEEGKAHMVSVEGKEETLREAVATGSIRMSPSTVELIARGGIQKGDVLSIAQVAGILGAKMTPRIIPLCHPIFITGADLRFQMEENRIVAAATVKTVGRTGVEMEALVAVSTALLTIYDMCKAADKEMVLEEIYLLEKTGGKSGDYRRGGKE